jgi:hypothetical protein
MVVTETPSKKPLRSRWRIWGVVAAIVIVCVAGRVLWNKAESEYFAQQLEQSQPTDPDAQGRRLVLGTWEDEYQGKRTMTLNEDGTGAMIVVLSGWRAALSAPKLTFNMKWSLEGGHLKKQTINGEPEAKVKIILQTMGDHVDEPILELTEDRLLLLDQDGKTRYDWKRVSKQ